MMNPCSYNSLLGAYHDGQLAAGEAGRLEAHLPQCPACAAELEGLRALSGLLAGASVPLLSLEGLRRAHRRVSGLAEGGLLRTARALAALAACLLAGASLWLWWAAAHPPGAAAGSAARAGLVSPWEAAGAPVNAVNAGVASADDAGQGVQYASSGSSGSSADPVPDASSPDWLNVDWTRGGSQ